MRRIFLAMFFILISLFIYGEEIREIAEEIKCIKTLEGHSDWVSSIIYSPDGKYIASRSRDKTIRIWEIASGQCIKTLTGHGESIYDIVYSPDGKYISSGSSDKTIKNARAEKLKEITRKFNESKQIGRAHV